MCIYIWINISHVSETYPELCSTGCYIQDWYALRIRIVLSDTLNFLLQYNTGMPCTSTTVKKQQRPYVLSKCIRYKTGDSVALYDKDLSIKDTIIS